MIAIGNLANMYHVLPSEVVRRATTYDLMIADVWMTWQNYQVDKNKGDYYKTEDLEDMLKSVKK
jgi:hypothetical protein